MAEQSLFGGSVDATFSADRVYRYWLNRIWDRELQQVAFIMLNPSTADEKKDDPTVRRCINFAKEWGFGGLIVMNLFAFRATNPKELYDTSDPIGPDNDDMIERGTNGRITVAAWGNHGKFLDRAKEVRELLRFHGADLWHLGLTNEGQPKHPLYLKGDAERIWMP